jgi:hypothetical protein
MVESNKLNTKERASPMFDTLTSTYVRAQNVDGRKDHSRQFAGKRLWLQLEPNFPAHYADTVQAKFSAALLSWAPGLGFEQYKAKGGSVTALRYMVRDEAVLVQ